MEIRRPDSTNDFDEVLALVQACDRAVYGDSDWTAAELREEWDDLDLDSDAWVAVDGGRIAGVVHVYGLRGSRVLMDGYVHPELTGRGAGSLLLDRRRPVPASWPLTQPAGEAIWAETAHLVGDPTAPELLAGRGYAMLRTYHRMIIDLEPGIPAPSWPDGLELRPFDPDRHARQLKDALDEAFVDEWGHEKRDYDAWAERVLGVPQFDPELDPRRLGRRRDRSGHGRLPEAPRRLGPDLAARRPAGVAPARARAVAAPGELPPLRRAG